MEEKFTAAFDYLLNFEGGFSNHPDDSGGKTKYGVTEKTARALGYEGEIKNLTKQEAAEIYYQSYWLNYNYHHFTNQKIAIEVFEQAVNCGPTTANRHLQQSLNLISAAEVEVDGIVGPETIQAANNYNHPQALLKLLNILQGQHYISLVKQAEKNKKFIRGWLKRVSLPENNF